MKALMVNSVNSGKVVDGKMRDQIYMRHLREVEKINNRQAEKISQDIKTYRSINELHQKHKAYAFQWQNKEQNLIIEDMNEKMKKKMKEIKSYLNHSNNITDSRTYSRTSRIQNKNPQNEASQKQATQKSDQKASQSKSTQRKIRQSLHYRYRLKRQQQIEHENKKLQKGILSQKSSYLPQIHKSRQSKSVTKKHLQDES